MADSITRFPPPGARTLPHNLEAEQAFLGSLRLEKLADSSGYVVACYTPIGASRAALAKVVEQVEHRARHGGLAPGRYVVRCVNAKDVSEVVRVRERAE